jgi:crotonobetainyl-CoA:carnitine CoA-transferase CaiB-like acyl-CoA transferase
VTGALAGLRVLDLCDQQGAFAGKLLAGLGADVVLVEPPGGGPLRGILPFFEGVPGPERSLFFWFYAAGRRGITLDLAHRDGADVLCRLSAAADVVLESGPPGRLAALGCGTAALRSSNARLVVASITPFGRSGPYRDWQASDLVAQALGGMLYVNGRPDGPPLGAFGLQAYHQAGIQAAVGVMAALLARDVTGRGQDVDVSLQAAVAGALEHVPGFFHQDGRIGVRQGTLHWTRYFRVGRCRDGWVMHCTLGDWTSLVEWMKADGIASDLLDEPSLDEPKNRQAAAERVFDMLDEWAARYTVAELASGAQLRRIPYAAVRAPEALLADPHLAARGFFVPIEHPDLGVTVPYPGAPFRLVDTPWRVARPPRLGEHNADVYRELLGGPPPEASR